MTDRTRVQRALELQCCDDCGRSQAESLLCDAVLGDDRCHELTIAKLRPYRTKYHAVRREVRRLNAVLMHRNTEAALAQTRELDRNIGGKVREAALTQDRDAQAARADAAERELEGLREATRDAEPKDDVEQAAPQSMRVSLERRVESMRGNEVSELWKRIQAVGEDDAAAGLVAYEKHPDGSKEAISPREWARRVVALQEPAPPTEQGDAPKQEPVLAKCATPECVAMIQPNDGIGGDRCGACPTPDVGDICDCEHTRFSHKDCHGHCSGWVLNSRCECSCFRAAPPKPEAVAKREGVFEVGDRVRIVSDQTEALQGSLAVVTKKDRSDIPYQFEWEPAGWGEKRKSWAKAEDLEHASAAPPRELPAEVVADLETVIHLLRHVDHDDVYAAQEAMERIEAYVKRTAELAVLWAVDDAEKKWAHLEKAYNKTPDSEQQHLMELARELRSFATPTPAAEPEAPGGESYWVLERNDTPGPMYLAKPGQGYRGWAADTSSASAERYASKAAAESVLHRLALNKSVVRATEHQDVPPPVVPKP